MITFRKLDVFFGLFKKTAPPPKTFIFSSPEELDTRFKEFLVDLPESKRTPFAIAMCNIAESNFDRVQTITNGSERERANVFLQSESHIDYWTEHFDLLLSEVNNRTYDEILNASTMVYKRLYYEEAHRLGKEVSTLKINRDLTMGLAKDVEHRIKEYESFSEEVKTLLSSFELKFIRLDIEKSSELKNSCRVIASAQLKNKSARSFTNLTVRVGWKINGIGHSHEVYELIKDPRYTEDISVKPKSQILITDMDFHISLDNYLGGYSDPKDLALQLYVDKVYIKPKKRLSLENLRKMEVRLQKHQMQHRNYTSKYKLLDLKLLRLDRECKKTQYLLHQNIWHR